MILGIFLSIGDSFANMAKTGQDMQFKKFYLANFAKHFQKLYVFSYENEQVNNLPKHITVVPNKFGLNRFLYAILLPFLQVSTIKNCHVFRVYHLWGTPPAIITKIFFFKPFIFNWAFDYAKFSQLEGKKIQHFLTNLLAPIAAFFASKILAANQNILAGLPKNKTIYLPNGVDTDFFRVPKAKSVKKRLQILSVGRLVKQKNFESLIKALQGLDIDLTIVGEGNLKTSLLKLAQAAKVSLQIISRVSYDKMPRVYNQADIFVLPSVAEGHPKVLLEAMASSLPVIATQVEGSKEIIIDNQTGILTQPDPNSIRSAFKILLQPQRRQSLGKNARLHVKKHFDLASLLKTEIASIKNV